MAVNIGPRIGIDGEKEYRRQIQQIIQETKTLKSEYDKLSSSMDHGNATLKQNAEQHRILSQEIETQERRVKELADMVEQSTQKYGEADTKTLKWKQALNEATEELNQMQEELHNLPNQIQLVGEKMESAGQKIKGVGDKIKGVGDSMTTHFTLPIAAGATAAVKKFAEVDKTMTLTNKVMGNTEEQADLLGDAMEAAAAQSIFGMSDAAEATLNFARAGLTAEEAAEALAPAMKLAAGTGGDLNTVSAGLVATINAFGDSFDKASDYANVFAKVTNNSALDVDSLSNAMRIAAPVFKASGKTVKDAALYMGVMADNGIDANEAATSLKTGLARIASPAKQGAQKLKELGIEIFNADGSMKDSVEVQRILHDSFSRLSEQEQLAAASAIFGKNQMSNWLALINAAPEDVQNLSNELSTTTDEVNEMSDAMMSGFGGSLERLKSSIDVAAASFGEALAPTISAIADKIQSLVDWFNSLDEAEQQQIARSAVIVAAAGPTISAVGRVAGGIGSIVSVSGQAVSGIGGLANAFGGAGGLTATAGSAAGGTAAASASIAGIAVPAAVAVGALAVLGGAFVTAYKQDEEFAAKVDESWGKIKQSFQNLIQTIKPAWEAFSKGISPVFIAGMDSISRRLDAFTMTAQGAMDVLDGIFNKDWKKIMDGFDKIGKGTMDQVVEAFRFGSEAIKGIFDKLEIKLPHIKLPHFKVTGENSWGLPSFDIDWYAKAMQGGIRMTSPTIFGTSGGKLMAGGEAGAEWVIGESSLMSMIRAAVSSAGGQSQSIINEPVTINVYGAEGQDVEELAERVGEIIDQQSKNLLMAVS